MTRAPIKMSETAKFAMNRLVADLILFAEPMIHIIIRLPKTANSADRQQQPNVTIIMKLSAPVSELVIEVI